MILMYHNIGINSGFNTVSLTELKKQITYLVKNFEFVSIDEYVKNIGKNKKTALISVDDSYKSFYELFYPILKEYGIPAILFVPVDHVGKYNIWDSQERIEIMNWKNIREISDNGLVTIGSHGRSHKRLSLQNCPEIESEITDSRKELEDRISKHVRHFSYPFGQLNDYNSFSLQCLKKNGYSSACSTRYGTVNTVKDIFSLKRIEVEPSDNILSFVNKCENRFHKKLFRRFVKESLIRAGFLKQKF